MITTELSTPRELPKMRNYRAYMGLTVAEAAAEYAARYGRPAGRVFTWMSKTAKGESRFVCIEVAK